MALAAGPHRIREFIRSTLVSLGARPDVKSDESLLMRNGNYCGHRISIGDFRAVWFVEEDQVKFYGPGGELLQAIKPSHVLVRQAA